MPLDIQPLQLPQNPLGFQGYQIPDYTNLLGNNSDSGLDDEFNNLFEGIDKDTLATWAREDTAVQRLVADYKAAGINPWLIPGSVGAGAQTSVQAPSSKKLEGLLGKLTYMLNKHNSKFQNMHHLMSGIASLIGAVGSLIP